ncbi:hypothetical protein JCM10450v2_004081 [Rhodotorula kratochvilovae]
MHLLATLLPLALTAASLAEASHGPSAHHRRADSRAQPYAQCGGKSYSGATSCTDGWKCVAANEWYSQCVQGASGGSSSSKAVTSAISSVAATSAAAKTTTTKAGKTTTTKAASSTSAAATPVATGGGSSLIVSGDSPVGYASLNGGTTGGAGGSETTVSDLSSLRTAVKGDSAAIIYINGVIKGDGETVKVGSNKSILSKNGGGKDGLTGGGFMIKEVSNVIIRGLALSKSPAPTDLIGVQESTNVWVDHNTFTSSLDVDKDYYDGQLDITHAGDFVTISYNVFEESWKTSLIGHSANNGDEDTGHLRVTYHGNYFHNVNSRLPSIRFGTAHIFNNYYEGVTGSGINSREGAEVLVESNYFKNVKKPIETTLYDGYAVVNDDNVYEGSDEPDLENVGTISASSLGYKYTLEAGADIPSIVVSNAGAAKYSA